MVGCSKNGLPTWMSAAARVDLDNISRPSSSSSAAAAGETGGGAADGGSSSSDSGLGLRERALSAAGAAFISAIIVNPLDVAKTRLQAQAAGVAYYHRYGPQMASLRTNSVFSEFRCSPSCTRGVVIGTEPLPLCPPECFHYKGTLDVFFKVIRQEGFGRLWRGTNAGLALAIPTVGIYLPCYDIFRNWMENFSRENAPSLTPYAPLVAGSIARSLACIACSPIELARTRMQGEQETAPKISANVSLTNVSAYNEIQAYKEVRAGVKPPGMWKTLLGVLSPLSGGTVNFQNYRLLWTGVGAQLARDVPFSAICWSTLEPMRRKLLAIVGDEGNAVSVLGANFSAAFVAGSLAAAATCPLDVAKTRRQIEKDPQKAMKMTTRQTLVDIWRTGGVKGLFTGVGPRVGRAGPSVGIVVSFYEVVKYALNQRHTFSS